MSLPPSPCIRNCCLNNDICIGCHRHIDEIVGWAAADGPMREQILKRAAQRAAKAVPPGNGSGTTDSPS